jgi:hypothetical protein
VAAVEAERHAAEAYLAALDVAEHLDEVVPVAERQKAWALGRLVA